MCLAGVTLITQFHRAAKRTPQFLTSSFSLFTHIMSPSSKTSPHSGQNFGGLDGSAGSHPHLSHLYRGTTAGLGFPHSMQNLPGFSA